MSGDGSRCDVRRVNGNKTYEAPYDPGYEPSLAPAMKNFAPNLTFDYGSRVAEAWLDR